MSLCVNPRCPKPDNPDNIVFCTACGSELLLSGRYRVNILLGSGGFGNTYEVSHAGTLKVLKILQVDSIPPQSRAKVLSLFQQEAKVLTHLNHPGIPKGDRYFEFFPRNSQEPVHCLVMEKIEGVDLQDYLSKRGRPIDQELAVDWLKELAAILAQVHGENFFHRDIKPANIMLKPDGKLALIDFGTAREVTGTYYVKQQGGQVTGVVSAGYTPPEQLNGHAVLQSDFFALGRTFVYLLTGFEPLDADIYDAYNDELCWRERAAGVVPVLADFIDDLMAPKPKQRPANTEAILQRLAEIDRALRSPRRPISPPPVSPQYRVHVIGSPPPPPPPPPPPSITWENAQLERTITGHSNLIFCVAISPDGKTLASGSKDKTIKIWNLSTGKELRTLGDWFSEHSDGIYSVAISPDGKTLASGSVHSTIKLWNLSTGQEIRTLKGHLSPVNSVAFSPDGLTLASGSYDKTIKLWNLSTGQEIRTFTGHSGAVFSVAISPDGQTLASGSFDSTIKLWNLSTGQEIRTFKGHLSPVNSVAFSPDGLTLASGSYDKTIKLWNLSTGQEIRTFTGHSGAVFSVAISPDGQTLASGSFDSTIKLWNLSAWREIRTLTGHLGAVRSVAFSPDGKTLVSGSDDKTIKIWRAQA